MAEQLRRPSWVTPGGLAIDAAGNLYVAQPATDVVRKVAASSGTITTVAGNGSGGTAGDGGLATSADLSRPSAVALDAAGNLYIADTSNALIRKVNAGTGVISTVVGSAGNHGLSGYSGDGGPATGAELSQPQGVAVDAAGNLYIADMGNQAIRMVNASSGVITTVVGGGFPGLCQTLGGDGGAAISAGLCSPSGVAIDKTGKLYIADTNNQRIREVMPAAAPPTTPAAAPTISLAAGTYPGPQTVTITDSAPGASIYVTLDGTSPTTVSPGYNGPIAVTGSATVQAVAAAPGYLPSPAASAVYSITAPPTSLISTIAGDGIDGSTGAGGAATSAEIALPFGIAVDAAGDVFFSQGTDDMVWMVSAKTGDLVAVAGNGTRGYGGDGGPATSAELFSPDGLAVDTAGNLYIADGGNSRIRKVAAGTGVITTVAGNGTPIYRGDGGMATSASLSDRTGVAVDSAGDLYIADTYNYRVRMVSAATGVISTVAGNGSAASSGDGGPATSAGVGEPNALAIDSAGNLYVADVFDGRVRKIAAGTGVITTVAGNGDPYGDSGDGGPATSAEVYPVALAVDSSGNLYISNQPGAVREVSAATGTITRIAGNGFTGDSGDGGSATMAALLSPGGIAIDSSGNLYIADEGNSRIRKVSFPGPAAAPVFSVSTGTYTSVQTVSISDSTQGSTIFYTTDGSTPTASSNVYSGAISVSQSETIQAIAVVTGYTESVVSTASYSIHLPVSPGVTITPSATTISAAQTLTVSVAVSAVSGGPVPTGTVALKSGSYSAQQALVSGFRRLQRGGGIACRGKRYACGNVFSGCSERYGIRNRDAEHDHQRDRCRQRECNRDGGAIRAEHYGHAGGNA